MYLFLLDLTDHARRCLSLGPTNIHTLIVQIEPTGIISRMSLIIDDVTNFLPSGDDLPSTQSTAAPIAPDSILTRIDRLCETLGDTLREVVIALFPGTENDFKALQADPVKPIRGLRDQMPSMARRQRLVFRMSRKSGQDYGDYYGDEFETARRHVLMRNSPHWRDIALDS